jgi:hypothetical protein
VFDVRDISSMSLMVRGQVGGVEILLDVGFIVDEVKSPLLKLLGYELWHA